MNGFVSYLRRYTASQRDNQSSREAAAPAQLQSSTAETEAVLAHMPYP